MLTNDELRNLIPKSGDPKSPFLISRHREIDFLLTAHIFTQYELQLLKQDIEHSTMIYEARQKAKKEAKNAKNKR